MENLGTQRNRHELRTAKPAPGSGVSGAIRGGRMVWRRCWCWRMSRRNGRSQRASGWLRRCERRRASNRIVASWPLARGPPIPNTGLPRCCPAARTIRKVTRHGRAIARFKSELGARANPSLAHMPDLEAAIRNEAIQAKADPALLAQFESLRLNLGTGRYRSFRFARRWPMGRH